MDNARRNELLDATLAYITENGLSDFTLRGVAASIGTSHRMLIYYFGSKAELERAIVDRTVEILTAPVAETEQAAADLDTRVVYERTWTVASDPAAAPLMRLYFDLASRATHGDPLATKVVEAMRSHAKETTLAARPGLSEQEALFGAAVMSAFMKGLLLEHLSGSTIADSRDVLEHFIQILEASKRS